MPPLPWLSHTQRSPSQNSWRRVPSAPVTKTCRSWQATGEDEAVVPGGVPWSTQPGTPPWVTRDISRPSVVTTKTRLVRAAPTQRITGVTGSTPSRGWVGFVSQ